MDTITQAGAGLISRRREIGLSQADLAALLGVKRQQIQRWEASEYAGASLHNVIRVDRMLRQAGASSKTASLAAEEPASYVAADLTDHSSAAVGSADPPARDLGDVVFRIRRAAPELRERFGVNRIGVFGSFARGEQTSDSDIDLIVEVDEPSIHTIFGAEEALAGLLGRKVDAGALSTLRPRVRPYVERELVDVWRA